jgi:hypothetical protein
MSEIYSYIYVNKMMVYFWENNSFKDKKNDMFIINIPQLLGKDINT